MDFVKQLTDNVKAEGSKRPADETEKKGDSSGGLLDKLGNKMNEAAGGGKKSEKDEDLLDKGVDFVQEKFLGEGRQDNESAIEQAKDEKISDFIRGQYKSATGKEFPVADKGKKVEF